MTRWRQALARSGALLALLALGSVAAPGCQSSTKTTASKATGITRWVHSDLRVANLQDVRLAEARFAEICRGDIHTGVARPVNGAVFMAANAHVLPDAMASQLACALDAPGHATCNDLKSCVGANSAVPTDVPVCDSQTLIGRNAKQGDAVAVACSAFGEQCFTTRVGGLCGLGQCKDGETYTCDGDSIIACVQGVRTKTPCGAGMTCGEQAGTHMTDCIGKGAACSADRCDGDVAVRCEGASGAGREARMDCSKWGLTCQMTSNKALCVPKQATCDSSKDPARCKGSALEICVSGALWDVSCSSLESGTQCKPGIGYAGEAGCG